MSERIRNPHLDPANWHPGDAHAHSDYSRLDARLLVRALPASRLILALILRMILRFKFGDVSNYDRYNIEGHGDMRSFAKSLKKNHMDWVCLTEHGTNLGLPVYGAIQDPFGYSKEAGDLRWRKQTAEIDAISRLVKCSLIQAEELGSLWHYGHLLTYGHEDFFDDDPKRTLLASYLFGLLGVRLARFYREADKEQDELIEHVITSPDHDAFGYIAHPLGGTHEWDGFERYLREIPIDTDSHRLRGFEMMSGKAHSGSKMDILAEKWDMHLKEGRRLRIIGGSDAHEPRKIGNRGIRTYAFVDNPPKRPVLRKERILQALRMGYSIVTNGPTAFFSASNNGERAGIGSVLTVDPLKPLRIECKLEEGTQVLLHYAVDSEKYVQEIDNSGSELDIGKIQKRGFLRLEAFRPSDATRCFTNPIFLVRK